MIADRYELEDLVGSGGMSSVYRARDRMLERNVALKVLHEHFGADPDYVERFRREARSVAQLAHPNVVTVIDRGEDGGRQFIVFELVDGESLKSLVAREGALPVRRALELGLQIASALAFAHKQGLVHRDVKPQNVLLDSAGRAKVTDFGIARSLSVQGLTQTGTVLGTSDYIAPEQAQGDAVDERTDVYSLGIVLYELLTGDVPFRGENFVTVAMQHVHQAPPSVIELRPDVPLRLDAAVGRALAKDPAERFASMDELVAELRACLTELRAPEEDATMIVPRRTERESRPRRGKSARRRPLLAALAVGVAVAVAVAAAVALRDGSSTKHAAKGGGKPIALTGIAVYDPPPGDGHEHDEDVAKATDHHPATYWTTEHYRSFQKKGVGLVLGIKGPRNPSRVTVITDTPGFTAEIRAGGSAAGPFTRVSDSETVGRTTTFQLHRGSPGRYLLVWITRLNGVAHLNEVTAR